MPSDSRDPRVTYLRFPTEQEGRRSYDGFAVSVDRVTLCTGPAHPNERIEVVVELDGVRWIAEVPLLPRQQTPRCATGLCNLHPLSAEREAQALTIRRIRD